MNPNRMVFSHLLALPLIAVLTQGALLADNKASATRSDTDLRKSVENRLSMDPRVNAADIEVAAENGSVTLSGTVDNLLDKEHAKQNAQSVKGVKSVSDKLAIRKTERSDAEIQKEIIQSLTLNPMVNASRIQIEVQEGVVSMGGTVESPNAKDQAEHVAKGVDGVREVVNNIRILKRSRTYEAAKQASKEGWTL